MPELFPYLQYYTDQRNMPGEYILSGSQHYVNNLILFRSALVHGWLPADVARPEACVLSQL